MTAAPHKVLGAGMVQAGMSVEDLWVGYFSLGGFGGPETVRSYLGGAEFSRMEYDLLATAINDHFVDQGRDHPVPYHEDLL
ncbi:MAG: hypothetical protein ACLGI2_07670 [Acidimicrobiia bacterium]